MIEVEDDFAQPPKLTSVKMKLEECLISELICYIFPPYICPTIHKQESFCGELFSLSSQSAIWSLGEGSRESWSFLSELFFNQADV